MVTKQQQLQQQQAAVEQAWAVAVAQAAARM
jgi:hypothetical protein